ncbi:N-acetylmuramoyl-L-alanine amidase [Thermodesulfovibrio sp.]|uniref:N-acetylmuramoyl-L-alanine amidase n=1 Tax=Thermodesulfovibrio sp. TaxID=2067987 RepID=UPI0030AC5876
MFKFLIFFLLCCSLGAVFAEEKYQITDIRYYETAQGLRVVIESSGQLEFSKGQLKNPERLFFDFKNTILSREIKREFLTSKSLVNRIRVGQFDSNTVRVVFDLLSSEYEFKLIQLEDPFRLVIDIYQDTKGSNTSPEKEIVRSSKSPTFKRKIVIDPGHGGKDPGAIGHNGLMEKDVVLDVALKVRDLMRESSKYEIILTRDKDVYIPLNERTELANRVKADLFISIHTNAAPNSFAKGIETYLLNWTDDEEAIRVAARENSISVAKMRQMKGELGFMLASLEREAKRDDSVKLAGYIHNSLTRNLKSSFSRNDNGVKQALFYVLVGAQMPSCLLEISYISNPEEEKLLTNDSYRAKIAASIVEGIDNYFSKAENIKNVKYTNKFLKRTDLGKSKVKKEKSSKL